MSPSEKRRQEILKVLQSSQKPESASSLARRFSVSRQIIVGDIALLRAASYALSLIHIYFPAFEDHGFAKHGLLYFLHSGGVPGVCPVLRNHLRAHGPHLLPHCELKDAMNLVKNRHTALVEAAFFPQGLGPVFSCSVQRPEDFSHKTGLSRQNVLY